MAEDPVRTLTARPDRVTGNGTRSGTDPGSDLEIPSGGQRRRIDVPQVLVAVLVVAGCAVGALLWANASQTRTPVLALSTDIGRGEVLESAAVRIVNVDADSELQWVPASSLDNFVGSVATTDLEAGTLLTPAQFSTGAVLEAGQAVVGAALDVGEYPVPDLRAGDRVDAYLMPTSSDAVRDSDGAAGDRRASQDEGTGEPGDGGGPAGDPENNSGGPAGEAGEGGESPVGAGPEDSELSAVEPTGDALDVRLLARAVDVFDVAETQSAVFVSLRVPTELAGDLAAAADLGRLRLVLVTAVEEARDG